MSYVKTKIRVDQTSPRLRDNTTSQDQTWSRIPSSNQNRKNAMPKFYVQSGNVKMVLQARDSRCAAIWAAHRTLSESLPFLCEDATDYAALADLKKLADNIRVSQRGFDRPDAATFDTLDIITEWNQLLVALDRLQAAVEANAECEVRNAE